MYQSTNNVGSKLAYDHVSYYFTTEQEDNTEMMPYLLNSPFTLTRTNDTIFGSGMGGTIHWSSRVAEDFQHFCLRFWYHWGLRVPFDLWEQTRSGMLFSFASIQHALCSFWIFPFHISNFLSGLTRADKSTYAWAGLAKVGDCWWKSHPGFDILAKTKDRRSVIYSLFRT